MIYFFIVYSYEYLINFKEYYENFSLYMCPSPTKTMKNSIPPKDCSGAAMSALIQSKSEFSRLTYQINIKKEIRNNE